MRINRRGFLQVMGATAVSAGAQMTFDPRSSLWLPMSEQALADKLMAENLAEAAADVSPVLTSPAQMEEAIGEVLQSSQKVSEAIDRLSLLDDAAAKLAKALGHRMEAQRAIILKSVEAKPMVYKTTKEGTVYEAKRRVRQAISPVSWLDIEEVGVGVFDHYGRSAIGVGGYVMAKDIDPLASELAGKYNRDTVVAPIARELRPGVAFTPDVLVGVGVDPYTGLHARIVQAINIYGRTTSHVEIAAGSFHSRERHDRTRGYYR